MSNNYLENLREKLSPLCLHENPGDPSMRCERLNGHDEATHRYMETIASEDGIYRQIYEWEGEKL